LSRLSSAISLAWLPPSVILSKICQVDLSLYSPLFEDRFLVFSSPSFPFFLLGIPHRVFTLSFTFSFPLRGFFPSPILVLPILSRYSSNKNDGLTSPPNSPIPTSLLANQQSSVLFEAHFRGPARSPSRIFPDCRLTISCGYRDHTSPPWVVPSQELAPYSTRPPGADFFEEFIVSGFLFFNPTSLPPPLPPFQDLLASFPYQPLRFPRRTSSRKSFLFFVRIANPFSSDSFELKLSFHPLYFCFPCQISSTLDFASSTLRRPSDTFFFLELTSLPQLDSLFFSTRPRYSSLFGCFSIVIVL